MSATGVDYHGYILSPAWRLKRAARLKRDGGRCVVCGDRAANVHHLTYERLGDEDVRRDLVSVCRRCHGLLDAIEKAERRERRGAQPSKEGSMDRPGVFRGWLDWRVLVLLVVVTVLLLALVVVEGAGAAPAAAPQAAPTMAQRLPTRWRLARPYQSGAVRGSISYPNRAPAPRGR
jgi:hypothetical protein